MVGSSRNDIQLSQSIYIQGTSIGERNLHKLTSFDLYDNYDNAYLHRGSLGYTCVLPKVATKPMNLYYKNVTFSTEDTTLLLNYHPCSDGTLQIYFDDTLLIEHAFTTTNTFTELKLKLDSCTLPMNRTGELIFTTTGNCKLSYFYFTRSEERRVGKEC